MTIIDQSTVSVVATYTEPTTNPDNSPLDDLAYTSVYYHVNGGQKIVGVKTASTIKSGGGNINVDLIVPAPTGGVTLLDFYVTATDLSGNESVPSPSVSLTIERFAPSSPTSFTVV